MDINTGSTKVIDDESEHKKASHNLENEQPQADINDEKDEQNTEIAKIKMR
ncbi:hypothetical protein [Vibrio sp. 10N.286.49.B3]|uniref:hypothetical protein n=1 Tax=Vibrio sp. 10N.286.49.B3 TaxID=1880855 RepID=UPI0012FFEADB|nr:hypothetical protein [Vibrio sp. 10N.286.49.B3]